MDSLIDKQIIPGSKPKHTTTIPLSNFFPAPLIRLSIIRCNYWLNFPINHLIIYWDPAYRALLLTILCWCFWWWGFLIPVSAHFYKVSLLFLLFFPLIFIFTGWTVYHQTSERVTYKSSSKPRTRFLSGPVSLSICLYLFFSISPHSFPSSLYLTCLSLSTNFFKIYM